MIQWAVFALLSAFMMSLFRVIQKKVLSMERSLEFSAASSVYRIPILLLLLFFIDFSGLDWKIVIALFFIAALRTMAAFWRLRATKNLNLSVVEPLYNFYPLFIIVIGFFILGEEIGPIHFVGILILLLGTFVLETSKGKTLADVFKSFFKSKMIILGLVSVLLFSFTGVLDKLMLDSGIQIAKYFFIMFTFISINFVISDVVRFGFKDVVKSVKTSSLFTFLATVFHMANIMFYYLALASPGALISLVAPIRTSSTLFTTVIGGAIYHEDHIKQKAIAAVIMLIGAILIILG